MSKEALRRIKEAKETNATELDLSGLGLKEIPKEVSSLSNLLELDCSHNPINRLENLEGLTSLQSLNLSGTQISKLENLDALTSLQLLYLSSTPISKLENLEGLTSLQLLYLSYTQISKLENLEGLTSLQILYLSDMPISKLENLDALTSLQILNLSYTKINKIENLDALSSLKELDLSSTQINKLENLDALSSLKELNFSYTQINKLENLDALTSLQILDLSDIPISKLENLDALSSLKELDLSDTQINKLENLDALNSLQKLDLSDTQISKLENLDALSSLKELNFSYTQINKLENLDALISLEKLDLELTQISKLENLDALTSLQSLNLSGTQISKLENLDALTSLQSLHLSGTQISKLENLDALTSLQSLNLSSTPISKLENLDALTSLQILDLESTQISKLENLDALTSLQMLDLNWTQISKLENLDALISLEKLYLSSTQINKLENLDALTSLQMLDLSETKVSDLRPIRFLIEKGIEVKLKEHYRHKGIHIEDTPVTIPPLEIIKQGNQAILNYFDAIERGELINLYEAKMLLLGQGGVGKTSLLEKLQDRNNPLPTAEATTKGIDIAPYSFKDAEGKQYTVNIWDFGGQEIYKATHQFFLTKRSLYVLVDSTRSNETHVNDVHFNKWFQIAKLYGDNSPLLIFKNKVAGRDKEINLKSIRARYDFVTEEFASDLKYPCKGLDDFERAVRYQIKKLPHIGTPLPKNWVELRNDLVELSKTTAYISDGEFYKYCEQYGIEERQQQKEISALLHSLGAFLHFQENPLLKKTIFLQNEWATNAVYKILDDEKIVRQKGHFTKEDLQLIWDKAGYEDMQDEFLELMKSFELCYALDDTNTHFLAPQLLSIAEPKNLQWDNEQVCLQLRYKYDFLPYGLFSRFIVRSHRYLKDTSQCWKQGVVLEYKSSKALVEETFQQNEIHIKVYGLEAKELMTLLIEKLDILNESYEGIKEDKYIPCNCKDCLDGDPTFYKYEKLKDRVKNNKPTIECDKPPSFNDVNVLRLLDNIYDKLPKEIEYLQKKHKREDEEIFSDEGRYKEHRPIINVNIDNKPSITQTVGDTTSVNVGGEKNTVVTASEKVKTEALPMEQKTPQAKAWYQSWWVGRIGGALGAGIVLALGALLFGYRAYFLEVFYVVFCVVAALLLYKGDPKKRFYRAAKRSFVAALFAAAFDIGLDLEFYEKMDDGYLKTAFQFGSQFSWLFFIGFIIGAIALFYMDYRKDKDS